MFESKRFSERLKEIRLGEGMTQGDMASVLECSRMSYVYYENAKRTPDIGFLDRLHEHTGLPMEYLIGRTDNASYDTAYGDKELGLSSESILKLRNNGPHRDILDLLIRHEDFEELINLINDYLLSCGRSRIARNLQRKYEGSDKSDADMDKIGEHMRHFEQERDILSHALSRLFFRVLEDENTYLPYARKVNSGGYADELPTLSLLETAARFIPMSEISLMFFAHNLKQKVEAAKQNAQQTK